MGWMRTCIAHRKVPTNPVRGARQPRARAMGRFKCWAPPRGQTAAEVLKEIILPTLPYVLAAGNYPSTDMKGSLHQACSSRPWLWWWRRR